MNKLQDKVDSIQVSELKLSSEERQLVKAQKQSLNKKLEKISDEFVEAFQFIKRVKGESATPATETATDKESQELQEQEKEPQEKETNVQESTTKDENTTLRERLEHIKITMREEEIRTLKMKIELKKKKCEKMMEQNQFDEAEKELLEVEQLEKQLKILAF